MVAVFTPFPASVLKSFRGEEKGDQLVVTVKTVEWHLGHSFRKLDVDSRAKLRDLLAR